MDVLTLNPEATGFHGTMVMVLVGFALVLFASEKLPLASASLVILVILCLLFETIPYEATDGRLRASDLLLGFGHQALVAVCALMIAGQGLVRTGALQPIGHQLARWWQYFPKITFLLTLLVAAVLSAFMNNTPIVILLLPILISVSLKTSTPASDLLMPLGLVTSIGGMATTVGTSTNLVVVAVAADMGMRQFGMFDFAFPAVIAGSMGILYLWLIAPRLIPNREPRLDTVSPRLFDAQLRLHAESKANGKQLTAI